MSWFDSSMHEVPLEAPGYVKGVGIGIVTQNNKQEEDQAPSIYSVKVRYPWHQQENNSYWARIAVPMAGGKRGSYFLPEVGDEVLVVFERGDLRFPYIIGALWNGQDKPPENNSDGKNDKRAIWSRSGHKLVFDDGDQPSVTLRLNDGKQLVLDDVGVRLEDGQGNHLTIVTGSGAMTLEANGKLTIKATSIEIGAATVATLKAGANLKLESALININ